MVETSDRRDAIWRRLISCLAAYARLGRVNGAVIANVSLDALAMELEVTFSDLDRSPLRVILARRSWTMHVEFGRRQCLSGVPIDARALLSLSRSVAAGGWAEETVWYGRFAASTVARVRVLGVPVVYADTIWPPASAPRVWGSHATRTTYRPWRLADSEPP